MLMTASAVWMLSLPSEVLKQMATSTTYYPAIKQLTALIKEKHNLCQCVKAREGQPTEGLDCIEQELQSLTLMLQAQPTSTPAPTEPFREVIHQYTDILCTTKKQKNLTNSLLQYISVFNKHELTNLEEWLTDLETAADLTNES